jgi:hypothetical protein
VWLKNGEKSAHFTWSSSLHVLKQWDSFGCVFLWLIGRLQCPRATKLLILTCNL